MALEQLRAFREGRLQTDLGPTESIGPHGFPLLVNSELRGAHLLFDRIYPRLVHAKNSERFGVNSFLLLKQGKRKPADLADLQVICGESLTQADLAPLVLAIIERDIALSAKLGTPQDDGHMSHFFHYGAGPRFMCLLMEAGADIGQLAEPVLEWFGSYRFYYHGTDPVAFTLNWLQQKHEGSQIPKSLRDRLIHLRSQCSDFGPDHRYAQSLLEKIDPFVGPGLSRVLSPIEHWTSAAERDLCRLEEATTSKWIELLAHCGTATSSRPSTKWLKNGRNHLVAIGHNVVCDAFLRWMSLVDAGRVHRVLGMSWDNVDETQRMHEQNGTVLRGLLWLTPSFADDEIVRAISKVATSSYRKVRGVGPRAVKVGNACIYALSEIGTEAAVGQLALLKVKVKFGTAQKEIEKAFNTAAAKLGLPREEIEELGVPTYGLEDVGKRWESFCNDEFVAGITVDGRDAKLNWFKADGKPIKSVPAKVKAEHKGDLKELQLAVKDISAMLPAQCERIDGLFLAQKNWPLAQWRERYLDHPLVGTIARRLIWLWRAEKAAAPVAMMWRGEGLVDVKGLPIKMGEGASVELWHPISRPADEVLAWRDFIQKHEIRQPFKQAYREVYPLTEAERRTNTYSNRFASHVIRQHQFNALCAARGWKNKLRLMVDDTYPPASKVLPQWNLRAEYWIEGIGDGYGTDTNDSGTYLRLSTDQVRFYRIAASQNYAHAGGGGYTTNAAGAGTDNINEPLPLDQIPPLVFSEVMRDVDLFVGVASVGNDPNWQDGGPEGRYREYWQSYSFGDLSETAKTRRVVLERLLPRLTKLKDKWTLSDKFLVIKGTIRTYKIHLGSGNILMEPNDQYLCIVPDRSSRAGEQKDVFLPFEGDATLSIILSKAFLLAEDAKITDATITRQLK